MDLNNMTLIGNVVRDPERETTASGQTVTRFSLATTHEWRDRPSKVEADV